MGSTFGSMGSSKTVQSPSQTTSSTQLSPELQKLWGITMPHIEQTLEAVPLSSFAESRPQAVAGLTPEQQEAVEVFTSRMGTETLHDPESAAFQEIMRRVQAPVGESPSTQAIRAYMEHQTQTRSLPTLMSELSAAGQGRSGAVASGVADIMAGEKAALIPALMQETADRDRAISELFGVGNLLETRPTSRAGSAFDMAENARQVEQARGAAEHAERLRIQDLISSLVASVTGVLLPAGLTQQQDVGRLTTRGEQQSSKMSLPNAMGMNIGFGM